MAIKSYSIRIESELLDKLHALSAFEGRSANSQVVILIREAVERFEREHGELTPINKSKGK
ncbi:MAG TPA: hypothetical protein IAB02_09965 [Candidatus Pullichristensenella excrementigallinarum]|uniref:Arc-like DNA binding domain-containing protein n=1 Tax=Candidatus Pullichristensenella excrementigallinarum TaxID=2840907 RepID=A0A9D1ICS8_9FIRM|nr:hypothetical protein [Candidatus Pullichristensenella excrementigallinarum]